MRYRSLGWIMMGAWIGAFPIAAHADYLSTAKARLKKGDLKSAQIDLRNAVRSDPQNAEAHYWLGRVAFELGDPVAAEREASAARDRGFDPHQTVPLAGAGAAGAEQVPGRAGHVETRRQGSAAGRVHPGRARLRPSRPEKAGRRQEILRRGRNKSPPTRSSLCWPTRALRLPRADLGDARTQDRPALAAQPKSAEALLAKAQLLRMKNDVPGAIAVLDGLITDQPSVMQARLDRASLELAIRQERCRENRYRSRAERRPPATSRPSTFRP